MQVSLTIKSRIKVGREPCDGGEDLRVMVAAVHIASARDETERGGVLMLWASVFAEMRCRWSPSAREEVTAMADGHGLRKPLLSAEGQKSGLCAKMVIEVERSIVGMTEKAQERRKSRNLSKKLSCRISK